MNDSSGPPSHRDREAFRPHGGPRRGQPGGQAGRGARAHRGERSGQEHAARLPGRPPAPGPRRHGAGRRALRAGLARGRPSAGNRAHPPGALALPPPHGGREHLRGSRALPAGAVRPRRRPPEDPRGAGRVRPSRDRPRRARLAPAAPRARVVLMDEPTSSLQRPDVERLFAVIRRLARSGVAVVYISHFLEETREIAQTYTVLRDGRSVGGGPLAATTNDELIAQMVGRTVDALFPAREPAASTETLLEVRGLMAPPVVKGASFEIRRGEILGVFGLMGSGRTETVRALFGLDPAESGTVRVRGREGAVRGGTPAERLAPGLGYLSEDRKGEGLALPLSVADNVTLTRLSACARAGLLDRARQREKAQTWVSALGVKARTPDQPVRTLSGGNQQKVALGRLFHQDADVLLLDEPTRGIDIGSKAQIYEAVASAARRGKGVLMVSSYLPELLGLCDRLAVMSRGRLSPARPVSEWSPASVMEAAIGA